MEAHGDSEVAGQGEGGGSIDWCQGFSSLSLKSETRPPGVFLYRGHISPETSFLDSQEHLSLEFPVTLKSPPAVLETPV